MRVMGDYDTPSVHQPRKLSVAERAQNPRQAHPRCPACAAVPWRPSGIRGFFTDLEETTDQRT